MDELILRVVSQLELPSYISYRSCLERRIASDRSSSGTIRLFALKEKLGELLVVTKRVDDPKPVETSYLISPMPTIRFDSLLISPSGSMLALCTKTSVYVLDTSVGSGSERQRSIETSVKSIYCAFEAVDHDQLYKTHATITRVRWHPRLKNTLVLLTSNFLFFVQCEKTVNPGGIQCRMLSEVNLADVCHQTDSSDESDDEDGWFKSNSHHPSSKFALDDLLGLNFVDFDFGSVIPLSTPVSAADNSLYFLCETGLVLQLCGNLSSSTLHNKRSRDMQLRALQILPPSLDNYGEEFCSILCLSQANNPDPGHPERSSHVELPPDVLILANRSGRLLQGCVLHSGSVGPDSVSDSGPVAHPLLYLVDIVEVHPAPNTVIDSITGHVIKHDALTASAPELPCLTLEPSHLCSHSSMIYPFTGYYVIHDSGMHLVQLPWLRNLTAQCQRILADPLSQSTAPSDAKVGPSHWKSHVKHLICARIPSTEPDPRSSPGMTDGGFRLAGLVEFGQSTHSCAVHIVRAPTNKQHSSEKLVHTVSLNHLVEGYRLDMVKSRETSSDSEKSANPHSEFALQLLRILRQDDIYLPHISALSVQSGLNELQAVQFLVKTTEALRSGSLDRLVQARTLVERYTERLNHVLTEQYSAAMELAASRKSLQLEAERLSDRHARVMERQHAIERRLAMLAARLSSLTASPSKAEIAFQDELTQIKDRLELGLTKWFRGLVAKRAVLDERLAAMEPSSKAKALAKLDSGLDATRLGLVAERLRKETQQIKALVEAVKSLTAAS